MDSDDPRVTWPAAFLALVISHLAGDVLLQTEWQAENKAGGLSDAHAGRALSGHIGVYALAFGPALAWIGRARGARRAGEVGALVAIPHLIIDDGRVVRFWLQRVKRSAEGAPALAIAVDQSFHVLSLFAAALVAAR